MLSSVRFAFPTLLILFYLLIRIISAELLLMYPLPPYLVSLSSRYLPQHPLVKCPHLVFVAASRRPTTRLVNF